jgi:four helix bundle protein
VGTGQPSQAASVVRRFEDLSVWKTSRELARGVYRAAQTQLLRNDHPLSTQMKRAAISISSNIAEGYERGTRKQQIEFCYTAKGSAGELRSQVIVAHDVGLLDDVAFGWLMESCDKCSRQLSAYLRHLKNSQHTIKGVKYAGQETRPSASSNGSAP